MSNPPTVRIFFSSPGDVKMERETARRIVERLQAEIGPRASLEPYFWEHEVLLATRDYQQNIPALDGFDVVVCILWSRLGSPLDPQRHPRPDGGHFESGTEYEFFMAMQAHRARGSPDVLVFRNRTEPRRPSRPKEVREAVDREIDRLDQFFEQYFRAGQYYTAAVNAYRTLGEFEDKLTQGLHAFLDQHLPAPETRSRPLATYQGRPYLGLAAFDFADAPVFFGRTAQVGALVEAFQAQELEARGGEDEGRRFVLVFGASGSGKSSLARAGVLPMLVQPGVIEGAQAWRRAILKPGAAGGDPFLALAGALLAPEALPELGSDGTSAPQLARLLRGQPGGAGMLLRQALNQAAAAARAAEELRLRERLRQCEGELREDDAAELRARLERLAPPLVRLALLADQLEELFTSDQTAETRVAFVECLASIARSGRVFVLGTLRSDFYANCLAHPRLVELMKGSGTYALPAPGPAELGQMIRQPAAAAGLLFEENSASGEKLDELLRDAALRDPAALPLLGYTLEQLYERRTSEGLLTLEAYRSLGGLEGAIGRRAEEVFTALPAEAQAAFDPVWRQLVTLGENGAPVRRRAVQRALTASRAAQALVDALVSARLLCADQGQDGASTISIAHEALLGHWSRVQEWVERNREFLSERTRLDERLKEWESRKRHKGCLIPAGPALEKAEELLAQHEGVLGAAEIDYIRGSTARARALERRDNLLTNGSRALAVLALLIGAYAWYERGIAKDQRATALERKTEAETSASKARTSQVRAAYLLGIEQLESGKTREGLIDLEQVLQMDPTNRGARDRLYSYHLYGLPKPINVHSIGGPEGTRQQVSTGQHDGIQRVAALDESGAPEVFDLDRQRVLDGGWREDKQLLAARLNRTGTHLACVRPDNHCRVWPVEGGSASPWIDLEGPWTQLLCSDDGRLVFTGDTTGRVCLREAGSNRLLDEWVHEGPVEALELDAAGGCLASAGRDAMFYDLVARRRIKLLKQPGWYAQRIRFAEVGAVAVLALGNAHPGAPPRVRFAQVDPRAPALDDQTPVVDSDQIMFDLAVSRDCGALALAPLAANAELHYFGAPGAALLFPHPTYPVMVRFSPDQSHVVTATSEGTVRIFDAISGLPMFESIQHDKRLQDLQLSWDSRYLVTCTNRRAWVWDLSVSRAVALPLTQSGSPFACAFGMRGTSLWTLSSGSGLQAWDAVELEPRGAALAPGPLIGALIDEAGRHAVVQQPDLGVCFFDLAAGQVVGEPWPCPVERPLWTLSCDGTRAAIFAGDRVTRFDTTRGLPAGEAWIPPFQPIGLGLGGTGDLAAAISEDASSILVHDFRAGTETKLDAGGRVCELPHFSRDDRWVAATAFDPRMQQHSVLIWDPRTGGAPRHELPHNDIVLDLCFSPDGSAIATGTRGQIAQVWSTETGARASDPIFVSGDAVTAVVFSPDSSRLAVACADGTARVYDWREASPVSERLHSYGQTAQLAFSEDGSRLIAFSRADEKECIACVWELTQPQSSPLDLMALTEAATAVHVSPAGDQAPCDPFECWERIRRAAASTWSLEPSSTRSISPGFRASIRRWMVDKAIGIDQAYAAMPAVSMMRAAMACWRQRELNALLAELRSVSPEKEIPQPTQNRLRALKAVVPALADAASRRAAGDALTSLWLGRQRAEADQLDDARALLENALRLAPEDREVLEFAADLYKALGDCAAEQRNLVHLRELDRENVAYRLRMGLSHWRCGDTAAARTELGLLAEDASIVGDDRGFMLTCLGRYADALAVWQLAADQQKANLGDYSPSALLTLAMAAQLAGDGSTALRHYEALVAREPGVADPAFVVATTPYAEMRAALEQVLEATLARHPELRRN